MAIVIWAGRTTTAHSEGLVLAAENLSTQLDYCKIIYNAMVQESETTDMGELIYEGFLTYLFEEKGIGKYRYSRIIGLLTDMGCIFQVKRGSNKSPAVWSMIQEPNADLMQEVRNARNAFKMKMKEGRFSPLEQRLIDMGNKIQELEERVEELEGGDEDGEGEYVLDATGTD